jgi:lysosomal alpha-mannosidase
VVPLQIHTVGPIDVSDSIGKEVVARLQCDISSAATMFTDSNGREMMRRVRNSVPTWNMSAHDPVPVNFYPVTSSAYIKDDSNRM